MKWFVCLLLLLLLLLLFWTSCLAPFEERVLVPDASAGGSAVEDGALRLRGMVLSVVFELLSALWVDILWKWDVGRTDCSTTETDSQVQSLQE